MKQSHLKQYKSVNKNGEEEKRQKQIDLAKSKSRENSKPNWNIPTHKQIENDLMKPVSSLQKSFLA